METLQLASMKKELIKREDLRHLPLITSTVKTRVILMMLSIENAAAKALNYTLPLQMSAITSTPTTRLTRKHLMGVIQFISRDE